MASSAVRAHAQTGRGRGIPPTRNSSSSSPPAFRNPSPILRNTASPSPPPPPRNPPLDLRNTASSSPSLPFPRNPVPQNPPPISQNSLSVPRLLSQDTIDREHRYSIT